MLINERGNLAVNSLITPPKMKKERFSIQKKSGGFSKKYSPFNFKVKKSLLKNISLDIET